MHAIALNETIDSGNDPRNGSEVTKYTKGKVSRGMYQDIIHVVQDVSYM